MGTIDFEPGGYRFVKGVFQYSAGVAAAAGLSAGARHVSQSGAARRGLSRAIETIIKAAGRPLTSFAACELRSPAPFTEDGFKTFNQIYVGTLSRWGIFDGTTNPVARSNVCPEIAPAGDAVVSRFHLHRAGRAAPIKSVVVAGSGEAPEGQRTIATTSSGSASLSPMVCAKRRAWFWARWSAARRARRHLGGYDRGAGLYRARPASVPRRRDREARRRALRAHLAFLPAAGCRPGIRDGLPRRLRRARCVGLATFGGVHRLGDKIETLSSSACVPARPATQTDVPQRTPARGRRPSEWSGIR